MFRFFAAVLTGAVTLAPVAAQSRPAECLLVVDGQVLMDGDCEFEASPGGSFRIENDRHIAIVGVGQPGEAIGSWTTKPDTRSSNREFGDLRRNGGCWENSRERVCAWSPGQRPKNMR